VLWVGTASAEDREYTLRFYDEFRDRADVRRVDFFPWPPENLRELVLSQHVIVVGGGNTANMLAIWRVHEFDTLLRDDAALHFVGTEPAEAWTIREGATAYRLEPGSETPLPARLL
jgi:hypothetical protein